MRFLADMGVSATVVLWLKERGYDALHLRDEGLQRLPDREIFGKAMTENRVILTFDLDFGEIAALSEGEKCSVIVFRLRNTRTPHVIARLDSVLELPLPISKMEPWWSSKRRGIGSGACRLARTELFVSECRRRFCILTPVRYRREEWWRPRPKLGRLSRVGSSR